MRNWTQVGEIDTERVFELKKAIAPIYVSFWRSGKTTLADTVIALAESIHDLLLNAEHEIPGFDLGLRGMDPVTKEIVEEVPPGGKPSTW